MDRYEHIQSVSANPYGSLDSKAAKHMPLFSSIDVSRYEVVGPILGVGMLISMLVLTYLGHRYGKKLLAANPDAAVGTGAIEAAVFSLLGLLIAFTFS